jgi:CO/xanthine dehydrogenase Mo-binding subunit
MPVLFANTFRVDRVVCAVNRGLAVNPDDVRAQMEGGIGYGLSLLAATGKRVRVLPLSLAA